MSRLIFILLSAAFFVGCTSTKQPTAGDLSGIYSTVKNRSVKGSILTLKTDSTFRYEYMVGGCQDRIDGKWTYSNNRVYLNPIVADTVKRHQPALKTITWELTKKGIKPDAIIDNGCFKENAVHVKY